MLTSVSILDFVVVVNRIENCFIQVLLAWVLTNVCTPLLYNGWLILKKIHHSKGLLAATIVYATRFSTSQRKLLTYLAFYRSTNAKASTGTGGANSAVNGYMAFLLYSVAILACESQLPCKPFGFLKNFACSYSICGIDDIYDCKIVCW